MQENRNRNKAQTTVPQTGMILAREHIWKGPTSSEKHFEDDLENFKNISVHLQMFEFHGGFLSKDLSLAIILHDDCI